MEKFDFDVDSLTKYLERNIAGFEGPIDAKKFAGGQSNPTFLLNAKSGKYVLRRKPPGQLLKSAHAVDREYRVMSALADTNVPVAKTYVLCDDDSVIGTMFFVMEYLDGTVLWNPSLPDISNENRTLIYQRMSQVLSDLHAVDVDAVGLSDYGRPGNYFERQTARWIKQYRAAETETIPSMELIIKWLEANTPEDDGKVSIAHGDFRLDNMIFDPSDYTVMGLLDWELSTLGHPYADLAYQCMQLRMDHTSIMPGLGGLDRQALGIPTEEEYVNWYCEKAGIDSIKNWDYFLVFSFFRFASILQGVKKRAIDGNASSTKALQLGEQVAPLADMAAAIIQEKRS